MNKIEKSISSAIKSAKREIILHYYFVDFTTFILVRTCYRYIRVLNGNVHCKRIIKWFVSVRDRRMRCQRWWRHEFRVTVNFLKSHKYLYYKNKTVNFLKLQFFKSFFIRQNINSLFNHSKIISNPLKINKK